MLMITMVVSATILVATGAAPTAVTIPTFFLHPANPTTPGARRVQAVVWGVVLTAAHCLTAKYKES